MNTNTVYRNELDRIALDAAIDESSGAMSHARVVEVAVSVYMRVAEENERWKKNRERVKRANKIWSE